MPANKTFVLGLTGGTGCGKSEAARFLEELGARRVDADAISRALTGTDGEALPEIRACFSDEVFAADGRLNRRALADRIFADPTAKRALEGILHPLVQRQMLDAVDVAAREGIAVTVLDVPLLFETGMDALCDEVWTMSADAQTQIARVCARDGLDAVQAQARIDGQMSMEARNARAQRVIDSVRPIEATRAELKRLYAQLLRRIGAE